MSAMRTGDRVRLLAKGPQVHSGRERKKVAERKVAPAVTGPKEGSLEGKDTFREKSLY